MFWVYGFPVIMVVALGIAFRNQPVETIAVDVVDGPQAEATVAALTEAPSDGNSAAPSQHFKAAAYQEREARTRLRTGKTDVVVIPSSPAPQAGEGRGEAKKRI